MNDSRTKGSRPRPVATPDTGWWWDAIAQRQLLIQRCDGCSELRHPPVPSCPRCHCMEWSALAASGRGTVYSFTVLHHPQLPGFEYPLVAAVIQLTEGTWVVSNVVGVAPEHVRIGQAVEVEFVEAGQGNWLPQFRAVAGDRRAV